MTWISRRIVRAMLLAGGSAALLASAAHAQDARPQHFDIPAEDLGTALNQVALQSHQEIVFDADLARGKRASPLRGEFTPAEALERLLAGTGLVARREPSGAEVIERGGPLPQGATAEAADVAEVVVTAQKRSERLLSTPAPVTAVLQPQLARNEVRSIADYAAMVPGLNFVSDQAGELQIIMRGVSTGSVSSSTTGIYIDGAPFGPSTNYELGGLTAPDIDPGSLQRIEVLRGPQGTLYGASSLGGLVDFISAPPSLTRFGGRIEADGSTVDGGGQGYGLRALVGGPIVKDVLGFTLSGFDRLDPGYIDNPTLGLKNVNDAHVYGGRAALLWRPTADLSIELSALMHNSFSNAVSDEDLNGDLTPIGGGLKIYRPEQTPFDIQDRLYVATVDYDLHWSKLTSVTSYQTLRNVDDVDYTDYFGPLIDEIYSVNNAGAILDSLETRSKVTEELRLASPGATRLEWQGGFFFTHEDSDNPQVLLPFDAVTHQALSLGDLAHFRLISHYTEYAGFGDVTYHFTSRFSLLAGLRYSYDDQTFLEPTSGVFAGGINVAGGASSDESLTYLVSPKYAFSPDETIYARIASGYRPGGPNDVNPAQVALGALPTFKPDHLTDYELGYKASLADHHVTLDLSAFDIEWKDIQMIDVVNGLGFTGNGQSARSAGFEGAATWTPVRGLNLMGNLAYTHAYLTADADAVGGKAGDELPYAPRFSSFLSADYDFPIAGQVSGFVGGSFHYIGSRVSNFVVGAPAGFNRPLMGAYETLDLRAGLDRGGVEFELYVKNVNNSGGINTLSSLEIDGVSPPLTAAVIQPRTFGVSVVDKF